MKKLVLIFALFFAGSVLADEVCTESLYATGLMEGKKTYIVKVACTADSSDGVFADETISSYSGNIIHVWPDPGGTAPTTAMGITLELGTTGIDLLGGAGTDIDTTTDDVGITPAIGSANVPAAFAGDIVLKQSNNSVNSATIDYYITIQP